jgi:hypothetical protein
MLENIPISGYAICYGPLALTLLLFVLFASRTDAHARRTYLRRLDLRPESERNDSPLEVTRLVHAETPAGMRVSLAPSAAAAPAAVVYEAPPAPVAAVAPPVSEPPGYVEDVPPSVVEAMASAEEVVSVRDETVPPVADVPPSPAPN